jgi:LacI family transcriptional regulator
MRVTPTVYEVAERARVSTATVSRVLAGSGRVLPPTRERVLAAVAELGYVPSGAAKDLAARRTGVLGLCFPDLVGDEDINRGDATYWYDEVIRGMERAARRSGNAVLIAASHESDDINLVLGVAGRCDGLVVLAHTVPVRMLSHIAMRIPVVVLAAQPELHGTGHRLDHLSVANESGAYQVTAHLADYHGYDSIGFIAGPPESPDSASRFDGFRRAMTERGLGQRRPAGRQDRAAESGTTGHETSGRETTGHGMIDPRRPDAHGDFTTDGGRRAAAEILAAARMPRALVCANDQTAIGVMRELQHAGLRIPGDVALTGFDGISIGEHLRPGITTVVQPMRELGETAVTLIKERIASPALPSRALQLPVRMELRGSCGCAEPDSQLDYKYRPVGNGAAASRRGPAQGATGSAEPGADPPG